MHRIRMVLFLAAAALAAVAAFSAAGPAGAAVGAGCEGGEFRVVLPSGRALSGYSGFKVAPAELPAGSRVHVLGRYVAFDLDPSTFAVYDYTLTGAPNALDLTGGVATRVFASKVPDLGGRTLDAGSLEV